MDIETKNTKNKRKGRKEKRENGQWIDLLEIFWSVQIFADPEMFEMVQEPYGITVFDQKKCWSEFCHV